MIGDVRCAMCDLRCAMCDVGCAICDVGCAICDVGCGMWDVGLGEFCLAFCEQTGKGSTEMLSNFFHFLCELIFLGIMFLAGSEIGTAGSYRFWILDFGFWIED